MNLFGKKEAFGINIRAYKAQYLLEPNWDALFKLLAEKEGITSGENYWAAIQKLRQQGLEPPHEKDLMDQHKFSKYVDIESGMEIGFDHKKRMMGEDYGHICTILYDNNAKAELNGDQRPYSEADFGISIGEFYMHKFMKFKKIELAKFSLWPIEKMLVQLENSQSGMGRLIIQRFPQKMVEHLEKNGMKYIASEYFDTENAELPQLQPKETDYDYAYKSDGLSFYDLHCHYHRFEMEYIKVGIRIESHDSNRFILENKI